MNARAIAHVLIIKTSFHLCEESCLPRGVPCSGHREMDWDVICHYPNGALNAPGRDCTAWTECGCLLSDEDRDALYDDMEQGGPCPTSLTGRHHFIQNARIFPAIPTPHCWACVCPCNTEHAEEFQRRYGDGAWLVTIAVHEECDDGLTFVPLAKLGD